MTKIQRTIAILGLAALPILGACNAMVPGVPSIPGSSAPAPTTTSTTSTTVTTGAWFDLGDWRSGMEWIVEPS